MAAEQSTTAVSAPRLEGGSVELDARAFGAPFRMALVHQVVRAEQAARRQGTHATRTRGTVRGGGKKPWKQKGSGRARAGSSRNPLWTGGGTVFGPHPHRYTFKVNRKERRAALQSALSAHAARGSIAIFDAGALATPRTKQAAGLLRGWEAMRDHGPGVPTLVVLDEQETSAGLSFRNLERVRALPAPDVGVADILSVARLLVSAAALEKLTARAVGTEPEGGER